MTSIQKAVITQKNKGSLNSSLLSSSSPPNLKPIILPFFPLPIENLNGFFKYEMYHDYGTVLCNSLLIYRQIALHCYRYVTN